MRHLTLILLLVLAPLGWGEDVYYCVPEHEVELAPTESGDAYEVKRYKPAKFTLKYEADSDRLAIKGESWAGDEPYYLDCKLCRAPIGMFRARDRNIVFSLRDGRFNLGASYFTSVEARTGTCTKFKYEIPNKHDPAGPRPAELGR